MCEDWLLLFNAGVLCNIVGGETLMAPTTKRCCVDFGGISYEKSQYTIPCIGKLVLNSTSIHLRYIANTRR